MSAENAYHIQYLTNEFHSRIARNPQYSLRSFARDLQVAPSWLSELLNHRKGLSPEKAIQICQILGLSHQEESIFLLSVKANHSRKASDRKKAQSELRAYTISKTFKLKGTDFIEAGSWFHQALLELIELKDFTHTEVHAAKKLGLPLATVQMAIKNLVKLNLIEEKNGKWVSVFQETTTTNDKSSVGIKTYHCQIMELAQSAIWEQDVNDREFQTVTFAFDTKRIAEAKKAIREFQKKFTDEFYDPHGDMDSVYQFSTQLFRIDKKG